LYSHNRRYQTFLYHCGHSKRGLKRLTLKMLWILRTPLMRWTALMVLVLGVLLSGGALAATAPAKPDKSHHKTNKSSAKLGKSAQSGPATSVAKVNHALAVAKTHPVAAHSATSQKSAKTYATSSRIAAHTMSSRTSAHTANGRVSGVHEKAHRLAPPTLRSRAASGRYRTGRSASVGSGSVGFGRRTAQARSAVLTSRRPRASLRNRDRELPQSLAPAPEVISLHRRDLGLPPPLRGSFASLERQNEKSEGEDGLERIQDEDDLQDRIAHNFLVPVPTSADLAINQNLPESHRFCRPWTAQFLADLARLHAARFQRPLEVSSAVRTVDYQKQLERTNGNAAAAEGDVASPHLTGSAIDIPKSNMTRDEIGWMRTSLLALEQAGKLDVEEEFLQRCFHITVYKSYAAAQSAPAAPVEAVNSVDEAALPNGGSAAPANAPGVTPSTGRIRAHARRSRRATARPARALPA
jgi:hypothetical protein